MAFEISGLELRYPQIVDLDDLFRGELLSATCSVQENFVLNRITVKQESFKLPRFRCADSTVRNRNSFYAGDLEFQAAEIS